MSDRRSHYLPGRDSIPWTGRGTAACGEEIPWADGILYWPPDCPTCRALVENAPGFIGPLPETDPDRCPWCRLDPLDDTLHRTDCPVIRNGNCGVIQCGRICLEPDTRGHPHTYRSAV